MSESKYLVAVNQAELAEVSEAWKGHLEALQEHPCQDEYQVAYWTGLLNHVQMALKEIDADRTALTAPLNEDLKRVNGIFREARKPLEEFKELASRKLAERALKADQERLAALRAANEAAASGDQLEARTQLIVAATLPTAKVEGVRTSFEWQLASQDLVNVPRSWLTLDMDRVKTHCALHKNSDTIEPVPGLEFKRVAKTAPTGRNK